MERLTSTYYIVNKCFLHALYFIYNFFGLKFCGAAVINFVFWFLWCYRYKKLLCTVDLTKDFFFSYSYHVMCSFQKNMSENESGQVLYETMFVWNEFLTRGIRNLLQNTLWTVALVYGFFKQVRGWAASMWYHKYSVSVLYVKCWT